jgi:hypothetical protein
MWTVARSAVSSPTLALILTPERSLERFRPTPGRESGGRGWGRQLVRAATRRLAAAGSDHTTLVGAQHNQRAGRFYEKAGWRYDTRLNHATSAAKRGI